MRGDRKERGKNERNVGEIAKQIGGARGRRSHDRSVKGLSSRQSGVDQIEVRRIGRYVEVWPWGSKSADPFGGALIWIGRLG